MDFRTSATKELSTILDRLTQAADAAAQTARAEAMAEAQITIDAVNAQRATVQQALQDQLDARETLERAHAKLETEHKKLETARGKLEAERARFSSDNARLVTDHAKIEAELAKLESERAKLESERAKLANDADALRADVAALRTELESTHTASQALLAESNDAREQLQARLDAALSDVTDTTARAAEWQAEQGRMIRDQAVALVSRTLDRMLAVSATFATVSTEDEVLAAVVEALASEFSRVALFKIGLDRLDVLQHAGFDFPTDYTHLVVPQPIGAILDRAVTSGQIEMLSADAIAATTGTPFGGSPACALALPIDLDGDTCAVLYADDAGSLIRRSPRPDLRRTFAMLLRQLAAPLLLRLPAGDESDCGAARLRGASGRGAREHVRRRRVAQRKGHDLRRRLQDNLECARGFTPSAYRRSRRPRRRCSRRNWRSPPASRTPRRSAATCRRCSARRNRASRKRERKQNPSATMRRVR
jgi:predicted  nucleic acid-binding Zn-ribbon protein